MSRRVREYIDPKPKSVLGLFYLPDDVKPGDGEEVPFIFHTYQNQNSMCVRYFEVLSDFGDPRQQLEASRRMFLGVFPTPNSWEDEPGFRWGNGIPESARPYKAPDRGYTGPTNVVKWCEKTLRDRDKD